MTDNEQVPAGIWPAEESTSDQLASLGKLLSDWRSRHEAGISRIYGLAELLAGDYPTPNCPVPLQKDPNGILHPLTGKRVSIQTPWLFCPALVYGDAGQLTPDATISALRELIPAEFGTVDEYNSDLWR